MKKFNIRKQRGIAVITLVLLVIILLAVLGAVVSTSRTTSSSTSDQTAKLMAAAIVDEGNMLRVGFDLMMAKGVALDTITFNSQTPDAKTGTGPGLFNAKNGTAVPQLPPPGATQASGKWYYARGGSKPNDTETTKRYPNQTGIVLPMNLTNDVTATYNATGILLTGVTDAVCKQINSAVRGYDPDSAIPIVNVEPKYDDTLSQTNANYMNLTQAWDISALSFTNVKNAANGDVKKLDGYSVCVRPTSTSVDNNVYLNIIKVE